MKKATFILSLFAALTGLAARASAFANPATVTLLTAADYAALAKSGISNSGTTLITGDIGIKPGLAAALTGFSQTLDMSGEFSTSIYVAGKLYAFDYAVPTPAKLNQAVLEMENAYTDVAGRAADATNLGSPAGSIGGLTFVRGVYQWGSNVDISADIFISGSATDIFIFQITGNLLLASGIHVNLTGGALPENIYWQVAGQTDLQTNSIMKGNILCFTLIAMQNGATLDGRALAQTAVTLIGNGITSPALMPGLTQSPTPSNTGSESPTASPSASGSPSGSPTATSSLTATPTLSGTPTASNSASPTTTGSPSASPTRSATATSTATATPTGAVGSFTPSATITSGATPVGPAPVVLGAADGFSVLAGAGITNTGNSSVDGYLGTFPTTTESGYGTLTQGCENHGGDATTQAAKGDLQTAYNDLSTRPSTTVPVELGGTTLQPGVYSQTSLQLTSGVLTLDALGNSNAVFIFYTGISTLTTAAGGSMILTNNAMAKNIYWVVGSSATLGAGSALYGTIIALQSITLVTGATVEGRILAINGSVTMQANTITTASSALVPCASGSPTPSFTASATANGSFTASPTAAGSFTATRTSTGTPTRTPSPSSSPTAAGSFTATGTPTNVAAGSATATATPTNVAAGSATASPTPAGTQSPVASGEAYIYPSPARGDDAWVVYVMKENGEVTVRFHNQTGRLVDTLREPQFAGQQTSRVSIGKFAPGTYYYVVSMDYETQASETQAPRKFIVLH